MPEGKSEYPDEIWAEAKKVASVVLSGTRLDDASHASIDKAERLLLLSADIVAKALLAEREAEHARCNASIRAAWGSGISLEAFEAALDQFPDSFRPHLQISPSTEES